ncbi:flagellar motor protein MotB [Inquilinus sp. CAU 1745]|uniref:flagellar motor protein MotB n=1 Tax=Inquilinus sp. CAU 1745 TaxID=3140369 RepID=UPI00325BDD52
MAVTNDQPIIIIKKKRKAAHGHHHGGAWKVAYADFVTAMMAFFLLLWLLNVTTDEQKDGIADYFDPANIAQTTSGAGGVLGGTTVASPGALTSPSSRFSLDQSLPGRPEPVADSRTIDEGASYEFTDAAASGERRENEGGMDADGEPLNSAQFTETELEQAQQALAAHEQAQFEAVAEELQQAIQSIPELAPLAQNLIIDQTPEGLRIQIVDQERYSMFPIGSAQMFDRTRQLIGLVAQAIDQLPQKLSIAGHTDSTPYSDGAAYDNWELSTDRANSSRRALIDAGVGEDRISTVVGKADTDHLFPDAPESPQNRRISIVLLREAPLPAGAAGIIEPLQKRASAVD